MHVYGGFHSSLSKIHVRSDSAISRLNGWDGDIRAVAEDASKFYITGKGKRRKTEVWLSILSPFLATGYLTITAL